MPAAEGEWHIFSHVFEVTAHQAPQETHTTPRMEHDEGDEDMEATRACGREETVHRLAVDRELTLRKVAVKQMLINDLKLAVARVQVVNLEFLHELEDARL